MRVFSRRHPELLLLASLVIFAVTLTMRAVLNRQPVQLAIDANAPAPAPVALSDENTIAQLQNRIRTNPEDTEAYAQLGLALLQRVRETGDPTLYAQAEMAFAEALSRNPQHLDALIGQGALALARHQFADALQWGEKARAVNPYRAQVYGIIGDAQVELGRYDAAFDTIQQMVDTRPDLSSYSRVSYMRELQGDSEGAIEAMQLAIDSGGPTTENTLWARVQLGHLYFNNGDLQRAEQTYLQALQVRPDYVYAFAGIARVRAAQGHYDEAIEFYQKIVEQLPLPEFVIILGELYEITGQPAQAKIQYDLVRAMQKLNASAGVDVDLELALFDADHGADPAQATARARAAYARRPSLYAADALAWALFKQGNYAEAKRYSQEAQRLGTRDAALHYRAAMIAYAAGDRVEAREKLRQAFAINPYFSVRYGAEARALLDELERS